MRSEYALCYKLDDNTCVPIDLSNLIDNSNNLLSIINYTCLFDNKKDLLDELAACGLVPSGDITLCYCIKKTIKDDETNEKICDVYNLFRYSSNIYYSNYKNCFDPEMVRKYLFENLTDIFFYNRLFYNECCEFKIKQTAENFIIENMKNDKYDSFAALLKQRLGILNISTMSKTTIQNTLIKNIYNDPKFLIIFVKKFGHDMRLGNSIVGNIPEFSSLMAIYATAHSIDENKKNGVSSSSEVLADYDALFEDVWASLALNARGNVQSRQLANLGMFIAHTEYARSVNGMGRTITTDPKTLVADEKNALRNQILTYDTREEQDEELLTIEDFNDSLEEANSNHYILRK